MHEEQVYSLELGELFPEKETAVRFQGTAGEILERIADEWGLEDDVAPDFDFEPDGLYPSVRSIRAHQVLEDRLGKPGAFHGPDSLIVAMIREGMARPLTEVEIEDWAEEEEKEQYEEARSELGEEWTDGVWET